MRNKYGIQMYSIRDLSTEDLDAALRAVAEIGYTSVEFAGFFSHSAESVREMLNKYGLSVAGAHVGWREFSPENLPALIEYHKAIGNKSLVIPSCDGREEPLNELISYINHAAPILESHGMTLGYHNHSFEFIPTDYGKNIYEEIVNRSVAKLQIDVFWIHNAGFDVLEFIEKHKDRVFSLHLKDGIAERDSASGKPEGKYLGSGNVPLAAIIEKAEMLGIPMIVESEDLNPSGREEVAACMEYLKQNG